MALAKGSTLDNVQVFFRYSFDGESHPVTISFKVSSDASRDALNAKVLSRVRSWKRNFDKVCLGVCSIDMSSLKFYRDCIRF